MTSVSWPTTLQLLEAFTDETTAAAGIVTDTFRDERRVYVRGVLPGEGEVRRGDALRHGVAMRAVDGQIAVHPYTFRLVCRNGAIHADVIGTRTITLEDEPFATTHRVVEIVRDAVRCCCAPEAFDTALRQMRTSAEREADMLLNILPLLSRMPKDAVPHLVDSMLRQFERDGDASRYGLMNAVTATARQTRDPKLRWRLEELGGGVIAPDRDPSHPPSLAAVAVAGVRPLRRPRAPAEPLKI